MRSEKACPSVAIIGAGLAGTGMAVKLKQMGCSDFTVFEKSDGPGGVWHDNKYPGAGVDVPSTYYSYSFEPNPDWTTTHSLGPELLAYVEGVITNQGIRKHFRFGTAVGSCEWREEDAQWTVNLVDGESLSFDVVVSALGLLNEPNVPELPGMDDFSGPMFHTGRWEPEHDLTGKRIAYIGVGSTAAQAIPSIAPAAAQVDVYQREAGWVVPKPMAEIGERQRARYRRWPLLMRIDRFKNFRIAESLAKTLEVGGPAAREFEAACLEALEETVEDEETRAALTPNHPFFCKRPVISSDYYPVFNRDNVDLITTSVRGFTTSGVIGKDGVEREADVVILSTGFKATSFLNSLEVFGRGGKSLHELWDERKGPEAFMGVAVPEFPNFFMLYGPNSNSASSSIIFVTECQAGFVIRSLKRMQRRGHDIIELRPLVMDVFERWLHERLSTTPWAVGSCHTYYRNEHGKVVTSWPGGGTHFWAMCRFTDRLAMTGRRKWRPEIRGGARRSTTTDREAEIPAAG